MGLAEAVHSNRILIWGKYIPPIFAISSDEECFNSRQGGIYDCLFRQLSSCSLSHVTDVELARLKEVGYNDSARVSLQQTRRGLSMYVPPPAYQPVQNIRTIWPAVLAAYVSRTKVDLPIRQNIERPLFGLHIRHGDVKAFPLSYSNRIVFPLEAYLNELKSIEPSPKTVFFGTDSAEAHSYSSLSQMHWGCGIDADCPLFWVPDRLRSAYGSHTLASRGGCVGKFCALPGEVVLRIQRSHDLKALGQTDENDEFATYISSSKSRDVFNVVYEAVTDLKMLSNCDGIIGSGISHFTSLGILLSWYQKYYNRSIGIGAGCSTSYEAVNGSMYRILDAEMIVTGQLESSFLIGTYGGQHRIPKELGYHRWLSLENRFLEDFDMLDGGTKPLLGLDDDEGFWLPHFPYEKYDRTASYWKDVRRFNDPMCDCSQLSLESVVNNGADLSTFYPSRALKCWRSALVEHVSVIGEDVKDIIFSNILAVQEREFYFYQ